MTMSFSRRSLLLAAVLTCGASAVAGADEVKIGITLSITGPAAALGTPQRNTVQVLPEKIGDATLRLIVLDDAGDPSIATTNARRLVTEEKVDILVGSSTTPPTIAVANVAFESNTPHFALAPMPVQPGREKWTVIMPQRVSLIGQVLFEHMKNKNIKTVGMIGFSDSWGDLWLKEFKENGETRGLRLVADERYARADTSVAGQALKLVAARPDAVLVAASGTGAALPQIALRERGYQGPIYQTHGAVTRDFIRIAGKTAEGTILAAGPVIVAELQPENALTRKPGIDYVTAYEAKFGKDTRTQFGAHLFDVFEVLKRVLPVALKSAKAGTPELHEAIRSTLENEKEIGASHGVYNFKPNDRYGLDERARVLITVKDGNWSLIN
jgi:branched-chain amino acid transport system substrate-binding protein